MSEFTHLSVHSHYTLLGGTSSVEALVERAVADGLSCLALTDTNALYGAVAFDRACREAQIRPITGMTVSVAMQEDLRTPLEHPEVPGELVLLATGPTGYRSLCRISSLIQGSADRERVAVRGLLWEDLRTHNEGLVCIDGGRRGWVERYVRAGYSHLAQRYAGRLAGAFGQNAFMGLQLESEPDEAVAGEIATISSFLGVPTVALQPVYCLTKDESLMLRLLAAIAHNCSLEEVPDWILPGGGDAGLDVHWLEPEELAGRFASHHDALEQAGQVAARCQPSLEQTGPLWPAVKLKKGQTTDEALAGLARDGLAERYVDPSDARVQDRLSHELGAIARHGFAPLFMVVADIVRFAREADIPVSTRGSVANSLVAYCTGITTIDPLAHDLLFERFLSPSRVDPPDIDLDLCSKGRDRVLRYVRRTYGAQHVAMVSVISTMGLRSAVRETAKAYGVPDEQVAPLLSRLPRGWHPDPRRRDSRSLHEILDDVTDPVLQEVTRQAAGIVGLPHHLSVHPGGVVITPGLLTDMLPVQWTPKGFLVTQYDHRDVEAIGLPKIDLLGVRALTVLADAVALVQRDTAGDLQASKIPLDDSLTAGLLSRAETVGVFQCESEGARSTLHKLRARTVRDLAVANAFFKPGPSTGTMARAFVLRYREEQEVTFLHPSLEPILGLTKGVLIFQEQILRVATEIAGLTWEQADHLRRGMSKFRPHEIEDLAAQFLAGCQRPPPEGPGLSESQAQTLWDLIVPFSGYGFNQGHATAYAEVSYRSAYVKAHYPAAFLCARLANWGGFHHPAMYVAEAVRLGIDVRGPHINHSERAFDLGWEDGQPVLWMGLSWVGGLRKSSVASIVDERKLHSFRGLRDLMGRVDLQVKEAANLIRCGALDGLGSGRSALLADLLEVQRAGSALQMSLGIGARGVVSESLDKRVAWEREILGYPISVITCPVLLVQDRLRDYVPLADLERTVGRMASVAGVRLPGWTGGRGFHLWDGERWVVAKQGKEEKAPPPWVPLLLRGRWVADEWGTYSYHVSTVRQIH